MRLKIPAKKSFQESDIQTEFDVMPPFSIKITVDNQLAGLEKHLRNVGFKNVFRPPYFSNLPKKAPYPHKRCRNQTYRNTAINRWLNENSCKVFITNNWDDFLTFWKRQYGLIGVEQDLMEDYQLQAKRVKILFMNARHPYIGFFPRGSLFLLYKRQKLIFPKVKKPKKRIRK